MSLYDDATLILTPNEYDAGSIHSLKPVDGSGDLTVDRGSYANRVNSIGLVEYMSNNIARLDYSNGGCPKILQEPQVTNIILYSQDFSSNWFKSGITTTPDSGVSPSGSNTATKYTSNANGVYMFQSVASQNVFTVSCFVKKVNADWVFIGANQSGVGDFGASFNIINGTVGAIIGSGTTCLIEDYGNGWFRCIVTKDFAGAVPLCVVVPLNGDNDFSNQNGKEYLIWGYQGEAGPYATSYIPTDSATVTRLQDNIYRQNIDNLVGVNQGTLFIEYKALQNGGLANVVSLYNSDSPQQAIWINVGATANRIDGVLWDGSGSYVSTIYTVNQTDMNKIALIWGGGTMQIFINNIPGPIQSISGTFDGFDRIGLNYYNGTYPAYGFFNSLMVFDRPLTISEIAQL